LLKTRAVLFKLAICLFNVTVRIPN